MHLIHLAEIGTSVVMFHFHKTWVIVWLGKRILPFQGGLCSLELVNNERSVLRAQMKEEIAPC
jgi:hypothetical protein